MIEKILLATDGSATAMKAAALAADVATCCKAEVIVLSVAQPVAYSDFAPMYGGGGIDPELYAGLVDEWTKLARSEADEQTEVLQRQGVKASAVVEVSPSVDASIIEVAEREHADLIVMGTHGRSALARAVLGSVADRVVRNGSVPVLLAKKDEGE
jgi:nucleotide-binding universal stress UspA family protein